MNEVTGEEGEADLREEGSLEYDRGYGPAMFWSPKTFATAVEVSSGWPMAMELEPEIKAIAARAEKDKLWVIAIIT